MTTIRPSECPTGPRDAFDLLLDAVRAVLSRPLWLLCTALFPFLAVRGIALACILLALLMGAVAVVAGLLDFAAEAWTGDALTGLEAQGLVTVATGLVVIPTLVLGGLRPLMSVAVTAADWPIGYAEALTLTARRGPWLSGLGVSFLCVFLLVMQSLDGIVDMVDGPIGGLAGTWRGFETGLTVVLIAFCGHALGRVLRNLRDGIPAES